MNGNAMFFDSMDGDRIYSAADFREWLHRLFSEGVSLNDFYTTAAGGMRINVTGGYTHIRGACKTFTADTVLTLQPADKTLPRIDAVVLELDIPGKAIELKIRSGSAALDPAAPELVRTDDIWQLQLCQITVRAGTTEITQGYIGDTRMDRSVCGYLIRSAGDNDMTAVLTVYRENVGRIIDATIGDFEKWFSDTKEAFPQGLRAYIEGLMEAAPKRRQEITDILDGCDSKIEEMDFQLGQASGQEEGRPPAQTVVEAIVDNAGTLPSNPPQYAFMIVRMTIRVTQGYYVVPSGIDASNEYPVTMMLMCPPGSNVFHGSLQTHIYTSYNTAQQELSIADLAISVKYSNSGGSGVPHVSVSSITDGKIVYNLTSVAVGSGKTWSYFRDISLSTSSISLKSAYIVYDGIHS